MKHKNSGFTLVEMLLAISVLGIVLTMAFPDFISFFRRQELRTDEIQMREIQNALESYATAEGTLPDPDTWVEDLAPYTYLSQQVIGTDVHGVDREYVLYEDTGAVYRASPDMSFSYAVVIASGGANSSGAAAKVDGTYTLDDVDAYENFTPAGNDVYVKYTDRRLKMTAYEETIMRMERVSDALANYAAYQQNVEFSKSSPDANAGLWIYYPPSYDGSNMSTRNSMYPQAVRDEVDEFIGAGSLYVDNRGGTPNLDSYRQEDMRALMRLLGLPEDHCCSAVDKDKNNDPKAFFYYSNPHTVQTSPCPAESARPGLTDRKMPPRITVEPLTCG